MLTSRHAAIVGAICVIVCKIYMDPPLPIVTHVLGDSYDYVIVGAGTAGSVVAARLSEDPDVHVLVLEAGEDDNNFPEVAIPLAAPGLLGDQRVDWFYKTTPQKHACLAMKDHQCRLSRGKVLGGTSSTDCMNYIRGHVEDFNDWETEGCEGWGYRDVLPYFVRSEANQNSLYASSAHYGTEGPLTVSDANATGSQLDGLLDAFLRAGEELGFGISNINDESITDKGTFTHNQVTVSKGIRASSVEAFLRPVANDRPNIHIATLSHVTRVLFEDKRATGVQYLRDGRLHRVLATREVILAAGAVSSPQILQLSGVGPREHLEEIGIPVVADLPVGNNLQDHVQVPVLQYLIDAPLSLSFEELSTVLPQLEYQFFKTGLFTQACALSGQGFITSQSKTPGSNVPQIQLLVYGSLIGALGPGSCEHTSKVMNFDSNSSIAEEVFGNVSMNQYGFHMVPVLLHPQSRGTIRLASIHPLDPPVIDPAYLTADSDVQTIVEAIRVVQQLCSTQAFREIGARLREDTTLSFCESHEHDSDRYWECVVRHYATPASHPSGTCRMGAVGDPRVVVDPSLRVIGVEALRVIDASVMPQITSGDTTAPTVMIGEKGADLIKGTHQN